MLRTMDAAVALGALFLAAACQDGSRPTAPSFSASSSSLPHINITELPLPVSVNAALTATDCSNSPGPNITLDGFAALGGFGVEMTFSNNLKSTHDYTVDKQVDIALQPAGQTITIPKQPVLGGAGGNPFMWVQFVNAAGTPTSDESLSRPLRAGLSLRLQPRRDHDRLRVRGVRDLGLPEQPGPVHQHGRESRV